MAESTKNFFHNIGASFKHAFTKEGAKSNAKKIVNYRGFGLICTIIVMLSVIGGVKPQSLFTLESFSKALSINATYSLLAIGVLFVLLTGGIDISVGSILAVSASLTAKCAATYPNINPVVWVLLGLAVGAACGLVNGFLVGKLKVVPLIATLGTMYAYRGLAFVITNGEWFRFTEDDAFVKISKSSFLGIQTIVWALLLIIILSTIFLTITRPGRRLYAIGTNEQSAEMTGTNSGNVKLLAYTLSGLLAGLAGVLFASYYNFANSEVGVGYEMTAIAICVIGGVANTGGKGRMDCLVLGMIFMGLLNTLLSALGETSPIVTSCEDAIKGAIIIFAVVINITNDNIKRRRDVIELGKRL